jgi:hypothetical protein
MKLSPSLSLTAALLLAPAALAQSNVDPSQKWSWSENTGWMNWRDAGNPAGSQGASLGSTAMSGFVWSENTGWINLGDGSPANGISYANTTGADFGVNVLADRRLAGLAWSENLGWINLGVHASLPASQQARVQDARLRGYAWSENAGWINLDDSSRYVSFNCPADWNCDGFLDFFDFDDFVASFEDDTHPACRTSADFNADGFVDFFDFNDFVAAFEAGC